MRIEDYQHGRGWTLIPSTKEEKEHLEYLIEALYEKWAKPRALYFPLTSETDD